LVPATVAEGASQGSYSGITPSVVIITAMVKARFSASRNLRFVGGQALRNPEVFAGSLGSSEVAAKEEPVFGNDHPALQLSGFEVGLKDLSASMGCRIVAEFGARRFPKFRETCNKQRHLC
jgi:hypothetical protein